MCTFPNAHEMWAVSYSSYVSNISCYVKKVDEATYLWYTYLEFYSPKNTPSLFYCIFNFFPHTANVFRQWNYSVWYHNDGFMTSNICWNP